MEMISIAVAFSELNVKASIIVSLFSLASITKLQVKFRMSSRSELKAALSTSFASSTLVKPGGVEGGSESGREVGRECKR